jgi:hypothetical protein
MPRVASCPDVRQAVLEDRWMEIDASESTAPAKLRAMIMHHVMFLFDIAIGHHQSLDDCLASLRPLVLQRRDEFADQESRILARVLVQGMEDGVFQRQDSVCLGRSILTCVGGLMPLNLSPKELASRDQVIEKTQQVTDLILRGISADDRRLVASDDPNSLLLAAVGSS